MIFAEMPGLLEPGTSNTAAVTTGRRITGTVQSFGAGMQRRSMKLVPHSYRQTAPLASPCHRAMLSVVVLES